MAGQLLFCRRLDRVVLATTTNPADDALARQGGGLGWTVYRGDETDVLDRYYQAGLAAGAAHVMRLTADCPLVQPDLVDRLALDYASGGCDYIRTSERFAEGLDCELFSFEALERSWREARRPSEREHVTLYLRGKPEVFRLRTLENPLDEGRYRLTVDEPEDYQVVSAVIEALSRPGDWISFARIKEFLDGHPEIFAKNAHVVRNEGLLKSLSAEASGVVSPTDGESLEAV
jgi:spore coat polysaccharide biosynthesis protein SpsF